MITKKEAAEKHAEEIKILLTPTKYINEEKYNSFLDGINFTEHFIDVNKELPSCENGYIDDYVIICVKNKNKEDGIILYDICNFDGESWSKRYHTWEKIIGWKPIIYKK